ncbi:DUF1707 SHOCT-like domain-containing protein [Corynebacterium sp. A21]|uniref:DUF1707 SHOCT-like domain-containing protein n=1 Tax=Corynebacterium sp. A21 TaxID=3457318 RepID=UPI003FD01AFF
MNVDPRGSSNVRLSDDERSAAMSQLGHAMAEGRLSIDEYDIRCRKVAAAEVRSDLDGLFHDLPQTFAQRPGTEIEQVYNASEVEAAHRSGARPKAGLLGLSTIGAVIATAVMAPAIGEMSLLFMFIIPVMAILLYVMKIGPASWYAPSKRQLERNRLRELRTAERLRSAELRVQRKERQHELTSEAMSMAKNFISGKRSK